MDMIINNKKCLFKDTIGTKEADKIGIPFGQPDEDEGVYMARFFKRMIKTLHISGLTNEELEKPAIYLQAVKNLDGIIKEYLGG